MEVTDLKQQNSPEVLFKQSWAPRPSPKDSLSHVLYENCPISSTLPTKLNKHPAITNTKCRKFKKDGGKRTVGTLCVQIQEMPAFSDKCSSYIKHFTDPAILWAVLCMTTTKTHTDTPLMEPASSVMWNKTGAVRGCQVRQKSFVLKKKMPTNDLWILSFGLKSSEKNTH